MTLKHQVYYEDEYHLPITYLSLLKKMTLYQYQLRKKYHLWIKKKMTLYKYQLRKKYHLLIKYLTLLKKVTLCLETNKLKYQYQQKDNLV